MQLGNARYSATSEWDGRPSRLTVPEHAGFVGDGRRGAGSVAPDLNPGLNQRLIHPRGDAHLGNLPIPGGAGLVVITDVKVP